MNNRIIQTVFPLVFVLLAMSACHKDLNLRPKYGFNSAAVYDTADNYIHVVAKLYAGFVLSGNEGPAGNPDIADIDEGFSPYLRVYWNLQELPTDAAKCRWNDVGIPELNTMRWSSSNSFVKAMYSRLFFQITLANEFIRECSEENMERRGFAEVDREKIRGFRAEAQWIRAFVWSHAIDLFGGNVPFVTEADGIGANLPPQTNGKELFAYVEQELLSIEDELPAAGTAEYPRVDQGALWFLLAKMYLNAEAWTGEDRYSDCATYVDKIINSNAYSLDPNYKRLFTLNNVNSTEAIFSVACDGAFTQSFGGTTFLVHAFVGGNMNTNDFGITGGWEGYRATKAYTDLFVADSAVSDRFTWHHEGHIQSIDTFDQFDNGWAQAKYKNVFYENNGDTLTPDNYSLNSQVDLDFHWMRLAEVYLMYAECAARGAGSTGQGLNYINMLRTRANEPVVASYDLDFVLDERGRELSWEGSRRTDLVRFDKFTSSSYVWEWKGDDPNGVGVSDHLNIYPLNADDVIANPNLQQNTGY
ncbi:MAG: RagB/SusD family nutrient uptake outer membrane protein [Cryomorphaceae bacterium]